MGGWGAQGVVWSGWAGELRACSCWWARQGTAVQAWTRGEGCEVAVCSCCASQPLAPRALPPSQALERLVTADGGLEALSGMSRPAQRAFRQRLCRMVGDVRGLVRVK